jgi:hypothetical protein
MAIKMSTTVRNAMMAAYEASIGTSPKLRIYTGQPPALLSDAATGTLLVEMDLPSDWMGVPANGVVSKAGTWTGTAIGTGDAGYYRITNTVGATAHEQGTVYMDEEIGGDMLINNTDIAVGQVVTVSTFTKTAGNA